MIECVEWQKTTRLESPVVISEKIDGANCAVIIQESIDADVYDFSIGIVGPDRPITETVFPDDYYTVGAQSRTKIVTPDDDYKGFAAWVLNHAVELVRVLGVGRHYGEWFTKGGAADFYLFNTKRWHDVAKHEVEGLHCVPILYEGDYYEGLIREHLIELRTNGSLIYDGPAEGVVCFWKHDQSMKKAFTKQVAK